MERRRGRRRCASTSSGVIDCRPLNTLLKSLCYQYIVIIGLLLSCSFYSSFCAENTKEETIVEILNTSLPDVEFINGTLLDNIIIPETNFSVTNGFLVLHNQSSELGMTEVTDVNTVNISEVDTLKSPVIDILNLTKYVTVSSEPNTTTTTDKEIFDFDISTVTDEKTQIIETIPTTMTFSISASSAIVTNLMDSVTGSKVTAAVEISNTTETNLNKKTDVIDKISMTTFIPTTLRVNETQATVKSKFTTTKTTVTTTAASIITTAATTIRDVTTVTAKAVGTTSIATSTKRPTTTEPPTITTITNRMTANLGSKEQMEMSFEITSMQELRDYKRELNQILRRIEKELFLREGYKTKHFTPIATNLPKKISSMFLQRIGAALNVSPTENDRNELNKKLLSLVSSPSTTGPGLQPIPDYPNIESFMLAATANSAANNRRFNPTKNHSADECKRLSQMELVDELKQRGTYNPDLMAWDVSGVLSFLDRSIADQYERQIKSQKSSKQAVQRNVDALERLLSELNLHCNVSTPEVIAKLSNLTMTEPRRSIISPSIRLADDEVRYKRNIAEDLIHSFNRSHRHDSIPNENKKQKMIGEAHVVPFGCDRRGEIEDGYLRLCGACQAIRKLPDDFFPPFINEVTCNEDKACLYFYDYPHGKCKQRHMNFVVLRNMGTQDCQVWQKHNLNVRVSCECFVDEMSFFAKYV